VRDEADDRSGPRAPLPPEDRLWRHPSELVTPAPAVPVGAGTGGRKRALVAVAVLSGLTGAAATVATLVAMGTFSPRVVERVENRPVTDVTATTAVRTARAVAATVGPAVVEITVTVGDQHRRGSGVVVREDGLVVTSARLVSGATAVAVTWPSGRSAPATVAGRDDVTGLAALDVAGTGYPTADLDTTAPQPGERAITVAAWSGPGGPTLTQGVVSATGTHADADGGRLVGLIEVDSAMPAWADGGALVDEQGLVRGVCLWVAEGLATGFAVPADVALRVASDLDRVGRVDRGWLGIRGSGRDPAPSVPAGVVVEEVTAGSPAAEAGIAAGDVIVAVGADRVRALADVQAALTLTRPGQQVDVERARGGRTASVAVTLTSPPTGP